MKNIEIVAFTTIEINGTEYDAEIGAVVSAVFEADDEGGYQPQSIDIDWIECPKYKFLRNIKMEISPGNYTRCLLAVQNKIESLLESKQI